MYKTKTVLHFGMEGVLRKKGKEREICWDDITSHGLKWDSTTENRSSSRYLDNISGEANDFTTIVLP